MKTIIKEVISSIEPIPLEIKRNNRFLLIFPEEFEIPSYLVQKISNPIFNGAEWGEIKIEFIDPIGPSTTKSLIKMLSILQKETLKKASILFEFQIQMLDPANDITEAWAFSVKQMPKIDLGKLDYSNGKIRKPKMIIKPFSIRNIKID